MTTEIAVQAALEAAGILIDITYVSQVKKGDWDADEWRVVIKAPGIPIKGMTTPYFTGLGLRGERPIGSRHDHKVPYWTSASGKYKGKIVYSAPVKPQLAGILHGLIQDGRALDESFTNWCSDLGYEDDSIKAFNIYQACCNIGQEINNTLGRDLIAKLKTLLEDY